MSATNTDTNVGQHGNLVWERHLRAHYLIGVKLIASDYNGVSEAIVTAAEAKRSLTVSALAVHGVMMGALDQQHKQRLNTLDINVPDGQPVRWALNLLFRADVRDRVYGPTLMLRICQRAEHLGLSVGLYGNRPEVLEDLRLQLLSRFPRLRLAAVLPSRFGKISPEEQAELAKSIAGSGADLLFVGLGLPAARGVAI